MAIIDAKLEFSDAQILSLASASARLSTNVVSLATCLDAWGASETNDIGEGNNGLTVNFQVAVALEADADLVAKVYTHTASAVASGTLLGEVSIAESSVAGTRAQFRIPAGTVQKWIGVQYSVVGSDMVAGAMDAWLGLDAETPSS